MKRSQWMLAVIVAGMLAGPTVGCGNNDDNNTSNNTTNNSTNNSTNNTTNNMTNNTTVTNAVEVEDQTADPANEVVVKSVTADQVGWMVIHEANGETFGAVIGKAKVEAGTTADVKVTLDRDVVDGETLYAMLHVDAPADGEYTFDGADGGDPPALDANNMVVVKPFKVSLAAVTVTPLVEVEAQDANPANQVIVKRVVSDGAGFVVIHEDDGAGSFGPVIGHAAVAAGENADVVVTLDRDAVDGETLYAMLHTDDPADGNYTFDGANGEDGPVLDADGDVIAPPFVVSVTPGIVPLVEVDATQKVERIHEVIVKRVVSDGAGFVVIHEDDGAGNIGPVIGHAAVVDGANMNVKVTLDRALVDNETLYAMLHTDDPADGNYTFDGANGEDGPVLDADGNVITPSFTVDLGEAEGYVMAMDQVAEPFNQVVVKRVFYTGPGWIVIHAENEQAGPGEVLGQTQISAGYNDDVVVTLSRDILDGERLFAMLHLDAGTPGTYEFPGADSPVTDLDGNVITPDFRANLPQPIVATADKTLSVVSTRVTVDRVYSLAQGHIVIHEDNAGAPGAVIGHALVQQGENMDVEVILDRPAVDGETLHAMLHKDDPADGNYTFDGANGEDGPVSYMGQVVNTPFVVTVPAGLPAVIFSVSANNTSGYRFTAANPSAYEAWISSTTADDPTITLQQGWRYMFDNSAVVAHPIGFGDIDENPPIIGGPNDVIALSQQGNMDPALESDADVNWIEAGTKVTFTLTSTLAASLDGYRCEVHTGSMRGAINVITP